MGWPDFDLPEFDRKYMPHSIELQSYIIIKKISQHPLSRAMQMMLDHTIIVFKEYYDFFFSYTNLPEAKYFLTLIRKHIDIAIDAYDVCASGKIYDRERE
jgi:hypothetical protein